MCICGFIVRFEGRYFFGIFKNFKMFFDLWEYYKVLWREWENIIVFFYRKGMSDL